MVDIIGKTPRKAEIDHPHRISQILSGLRVRLSIVPPYWNRVQYKQSFTLSIKSSLSQECGYGGGSLWREQGCMKIEMTGLVKSV